MLEVLFTERILQYINKPVNYIKTHTHGQLPSI